MRRPLLRDRSPPQFRRVPGLKPYRRLIQDATGTTGVEFIAEMVEGRACGSEGSAHRCQTKWLRPRKECRAQKDEGQQTFRVWDMVAHGRLVPEKPLTSVKIRESLRQYEIKRQPGLSVKAITLISTFGIHKQNDNKHD